MFDMEELTKTMEKEEELPSSEAAVRFMSHQVNFDTQHNEDL